MSERKPRKQLKPVEKFEMRQFREVGMSIKDCATYFQVSVATAMRALAEMREKFGPEKLPAARRHLARSHLATSHTVTQTHD
jgi:transposase